VFWIEDEDILTKYYIYITEDTTSKASDGQLILLDMCTVKADPPLDLYHERLELPTTIMNEFNMKIEGTQTSEGLVISSKWDFALCFSLQLFNWDANSSFFL
jgi:hypothetical protein